jgi:hypothetical protein
LLHLTPGEGWCTTRCAPLPTHRAVHNVTPHRCQALRCHSEALTGHFQNSANILICSRTYSGEGRSKFKRLQLVRRFAFAWICGYQLSGLQSLSSLRLMHTQLQRQSRSAFGYCIVDGKRDFTHRLQFAQHKRELVDRVSKTTVFGWQLKGFGSGVRESRKV